MSWPSSRLIPLATSILIAGFGCASGPTDSGSEEPPAASILINQLISGSHAGQDTSWYALTISANQGSMYVELEALSGATTLTVYADSSAIPLVSVTAQNGQGLRANGPNPFARSARHRARVIGQGEFRFRITGNPALPELIGPAISLDAIIEGETLASSGDSDLFTFEGQAGDELIGFLQGTSPERPGSFAMRIEGPSGTVAIANAEFSTDLQSFFTLNGRFVLPETATYSVRIFPVGFPAMYFGSYRFQLKRIRREPEVLASTPPVNTLLVGEAIEHVGDVDEYLLTGAAGDEYNATIRFTGPGPQYQLAARILDLPSGGEPLLVVSTNKDSVITDRGVGRFALPASGSAVLQIEAFDAGVPLRGAYELYVHRVNRQPEIAASSLTPSDSVLTERIDFAGDVDEYSISLATVDTLNLIAEIEPGSRYLAQGTPLSVEVVAEGNLASPMSGPGAAPPNVPVFAPGRIELEPGNYRIRVSGAARRVNSFVGKYHLYVYRSDWGVEGHSGMVAYGDTVSSTIDPVGDVDDFIFTGQKGDHFDLFFRNLEPAGGRLAVSLLAGPIAVGSVTLPPAGTPLSQVHVGRQTLPVSGTFRIRFAGAATGWDGRGNYQFSLVRLTADLESHVGALSIGSAVTSESIDFSRDVDEFAFQDTPGKEFHVRVTRNDQSPRVIFEIVDPVTKDVLDSTRTSSDLVEITDRHLVPPSGTLLFRATGGDLPGPYRLDVRLINRLPEAIGDQVAIGDTISGESVSPEGDIDEFRFTGVAGQTIVAYIHSPTSPSSFEGIVLEVLTPSGNLLGSIASTSLQPFGTFVTPVLTLPVNGEYVVRVGGGHQRTVTGQYHFLVKAVP